MEIPTGCEEDSTLIIGCEEHFDVELVIKEFEADSSRVSLELPVHLTAEGRRRTRKIVGETPGLTCESYGFGQERQLHVFKKGADRANRAGAIGQDRVHGNGTIACPGRQFAVKNTFIDDWVSAEPDESADHIMFRSLPSAPLHSYPLQPRFTDSGRGGIGKLDLSPVVGGAFQSGAASSSRSTSASSTIDTVNFSPCNDSSFQTSSEATLDGTLKTLPALPEGLQVWNTFIHIKDMPVDERAVQSMPGNLFNHCLWAEAAEEANAPLAPIPSTPMPSSPPSTNPNLMRVGAEVTVEGLNKAPQFNGLSGVVVSNNLDESEGRYEIRLADGRRAKLKPANLSLNAPSPLPAPTQGGATATISNNCLSDCRRDVEDVSADVVAAHLPASVASECCKDSFSIPTLKLTDLV